MPDFPEIIFHHKKFYTRLLKVSEKLETVDKEAAIKAALKPYSPPIAVMNKALLDLGDTFNGLNPDASDMARAAFVIRKSQAAAGAVEDPEAVHSGCYRTIIRLVESSPALSDEGDFYNLSVECLTGHLAGRELNLGKVVARVVRWIIWRGGGRSFVEYSPCDASGLYMAAWVSPSGQGIRTLKGLTATASQKDWNRDLLDIRQKPCPVFGVKKCWPCAKCVAECPRGRWMKRLHVGKCPICGHLLPQIASGVCLECVFNKTYRRPL